MQKYVLITVSLIGMAMVAQLYSRLAAETPAAGAAPANVHLPGLAERMAWMHRWSAKLGYAIQGRHLRLADFYLHELEEMTDALVAEVPAHNGTPIGQMAALIMVPAVDALEKAIKAGAWEAIDLKYAQLVNACNRCHSATQYEFIVITEPKGEPPFNQAFRLEP